MISSGNSFAFADVLGKCVASTLPTSLIASVERVAEFFILKMNPHSIHNVLPELFAAFFVNRLVADNGELVGPRRYENKDGVALASLVHSETLKFLLRKHHRIGIRICRAEYKREFRRRFSIQLRESRSTIRSCSSLLRNSFVRICYQLDPAPPPPKLPPPPLKPPAPPPDDQPPPPPPSGKISDRLGAMSNRNRQVAACILEITISAIEKNNEEQEAWSAAAATFRSATVFPDPLCSPRIALKIKSIPVASPPS